MLPSNGSTRRILSHARVVGIFVLHSLACLSIGHGLASGFGTGKLLGVLVVAVLVAIAILDRRFMWFPRIAIACAAAYMTLVACDIFFWRSAAPKQRAEPLRGLHTRDDKIGYRLTPHARHTFEDGVVSAIYEVNSLGHRDNEPSATERRILLIGDSFTFGVLLDQSETIDKQIERITEGEIDAYNLGVSGYGPPAILETLQRCPDLNADHVYYLFYWNDAMGPDLNAAGRFTVLDGYLVGALDAQGDTLSQEDLQARFRNYLASNKKESPGFKLSDTARLQHFRNWLRHRLQLDGSESSHQENVTLAVDYTRRMQDSAVRRGAAFAVVIIPSVDEVRKGRYSEISKAYCDYLREENFTVIELLNDLSTVDYFAHDGHFNPRGAAQTAKAIVQHLQQSGSIEGDDTLE